MSINSGHRSKYVGVAGGGSGTGRVPASVTMVTALRADDWMSPIPLAYHPLCIRTNTLHTHPTTHIRTNHTYTYTQTHIHAYTRTPYSRPSPTPMHPCGQKSYTPPIYPHTHTHTHTPIHPYIHTRTHTPIHTTHQPIHSVQVICMVNELEDRPLLDV